MKTPAQYQAERRKRLEAEGKHPLQLWVTDDEDKMLRKALADRRKYGTTVDKSKPTTIFAKMAHKDKD